MHKPDTSHPFGHAFVWMGSYQKATQPKDKGSILKIAEWKDRISILGDLALN